MVKFTSALALMSLACLGQADTGGNVCTLSKLVDQKNPPPGLAHRPLPKIQGPARISLTNTISVQMIQADKTQGCTWKFFNSGGIQKEVWYSSGTKSWSSIWVYANSDQRSKDGGEGCTLHDNYCDSDNEGVFIGTAQ
ncbi:uncharacterized protein CTRU02_211334 [Colletotrichum truncatum]|uniref:Uncharacterized protein n=1 Tax=Colletotrichum truncatum TaxID=5467 RepID=A0ACC3YRJ5_COLTU|nr:uncharacterized protein CTRU02_02111 [Colletotrichum truncatum]KAF6799240.1 hypothetical protein CTRU02_02111 [Colletotrichum truncatum]